MKETLFPLGDTCWGESIEGVDEFWVVIVSMNWLFFVAAFENFLSIFVQGNLENEITTLTSPRYQKTSPKAVSPPQ